MVESVNPSTSSVQDAKMMVDPYAKFSFAGKSVSCCLELMLLCGVVVIHSGRFHCTY